jgi:glycosyltransferase involved in cell wall biosynthesis
MLLTNTYDPDPRVRQEALALIAMGCRVRLLAWDRDCKSPEAELLEGIEVERVRMASRHGRGTTQIFFYFALYIRMLWRGLRTRFDIVHCHDLDTLPLGFVIGELKRKPVVFDSHDSFPDMISGSVHPWVCRVVRGLETFLARHVDLVIGAGEKLREGFVRRGVRHVAVVGNWKELSEYERTEEQNRELREHLGIPPGVIVVTCITQLLKNRFIEELVEAARPYLDVYVILAGRGALEPQVRRWAAENPRVIYPGFLHAAEIPAYTCASDVIYCGFDQANPNAPYAAPNKLCEAVAAGKPLIAPDVGEIGDFIRHAGVGVAMPDCSVSSLAEAIQTVRNPAMLAAWTRNAQEAGRTEMNWSRGREALYREYSRLGAQLTQPQTPRASNVSKFAMSTATAGVAAGNGRERQ